MDFQIDPPKQQGSPHYKPKREPEEHTPEREYHVKNKTKRMFLGIIALLLIILVGCGVWFAITLRANQKLIESERLAREQAELDRDQSLMNRDFEDLNKEFEALEGQTMMVQNDSLRRDITEKYRAAKDRMEKLQAEVESLKADKNRNADEIKKLKAEIETLRGILRNYVEQIAQLNEENAALRSENAEIKQENTRLSTKVQETARKNEQLSERMTLAEKLNVTGVSLTALNKKGKTEKKVQKAVQMMVTFTIPQNNSTPVGEKVIYMRLISPSGQLLGNGGSFNFEGANVQCTAKKAIEYSGEEISNIHIYWDVNTALTAGDYTVELFVDNYRLVRKSFTLN